MMDNGPVTGEKGGHVPKTAADPAPWAALRRWRHQWTALAVLALMPQILCAITVDVTDFGAVGDGVTDNTAAFQKALARVGQPGGGMVLVPSGRFRITGTLKLGEGVTLKGTYDAPPTAHRTDPQRLLGSVLLAYAGRGEPQSQPFIELAGTTATLKGIIIAYPEWRREDVPPVPYPPTVAAGRKDNVAVVDCLLLNSYEGINFDGTGRFLIRNVYGYPSRRGIYVNRCMDIGRIENVHFWPFAVPYRPDDPYSRWINLNGVAFDFAKTDWQVVSGSFCFGYGIGYRFGRSDDGVFCGKLVASSADSCQTPIKVEENSHILISEGEFVGRWGSSYAVCVDIGEKSKGKVSLMNCAFWGPIHHVVHSRAVNGSFSMIGCDIRNWNEEAGAIWIEGGKAIIQANTFTKPGLNIRIGAGVTSAIITANQADPGLRVENEAGGRAIISNNQADPFRWPDDDARRCFRVDIGSPGDYRYVSGWNGCEKALEWAGGGTKRWSKGTSRLTIPLIPGTVHHVALDVHVPGQALMEGAGVYLGDTCLVPIAVAGSRQLQGTIPASTADSAVLELRCRGWHPNALPGSKSRDRRELGIAVREVRVRAAGVPETQEPFNACTGQ